MSGAHAPAGPVGESHFRYYGWAIVAAALVTQLIVIGATSFSFGLFVQPLEEEFGLSRAAINGGLSAWLLGNALFSPLVGRWLDRAPPQRVMSVGALLCASGFFVAALCPAPWQVLVAVFLLIAPGTAALTTLPAAALVSRWFVQRRGLALGIAAVGTSAGGVFIVPVVQYLIEAHGWRLALCGLGALILAVVPAVIVFIVRENPARARPQHGGAAQARPASSRGRSEWGSLLRSAELWLLLLSAGPLFAIVQSLIAMLVPFASDKGYGAEQASLLMAILAIAGVTGKLAVGAVIDGRGNRRSAWLLVLTAVALGMALGALLVGNAYGIIAIAAGLIGLSLGGLLPTWGALIAEIFGPGRVGSVMGLLTALQLPFLLAAVHFVGEVPDRTGAYDLVCLVYLGILLLSGVASVLLRAGCRIALAASAPR